MRLIQHKKEALVFYRYLSLVYERYVNPFFWTKEMRAAALELLQLDRSTLSVVDVGAGTGFTTEGIVAVVEAGNVTCIDQSPAQLGRARTKAPLARCNFQLGDAERIPAPTDRFDRYVSAGSIEYWPEPQRGVVEAYRVIKPGGVALVIGPLRPRRFTARVLANTWMNFPTAEDYIAWFAAAGFEAIRARMVRPPWVTREDYGIAIAGTKKSPGESRLALGPMREDLASRSSAAERVASAMRFVVGSTAGALFVPVAALLTLAMALRRGAPSSRIGPVIDISGGHLPALRFPGA
jgi:MPBQ/MSBQ methyltransferase